MKILFIGNSHTYFNDMPFIFSQLCKENGTAADVFMLATGGQCLKNHAESPEVIFALQYGKYDIVVLQEVESDFPNADEYKSSIEKIISLCSKTDTRFYLYENFAPKGKFERQKMLAETCERVGDILSIPVVKVGRAFEQIQNSTPEIELYYSDGAHASKMGSYLIALLLAKEIGKISVNEAPSAFESCGKLVFAINERDALLIKEIVQNI